MTAKGLRFVGAPGDLMRGWKVPTLSVAFDDQGIRAKLLMLDKPCFVVRQGERVGVSDEGRREDPSMAADDPSETVAWVPPFPIDRLGDGGFRKSYRTDYAYHAGAMANGIASEDMVIALGTAGFLASFGAAGLVPARVREAIHRIQTALPKGPYAFNLIHSPAEPALERECVALYLTHGVRCVEAAAYLDLTPDVVRYRVAGLGLNPQHQIEIRNRIIA
jgi:hypothetical protein